MTAIDKRVSWFLLAIFVLLLGVYAYAAIEYNRQQDKEYLTYNEYEKACNDMQGEVRVIPPAEGGKALFGDWVCYPKGSQLPLTRKRQK